MIVKIERVQGIVVLRYSGTHACRPEDHAQDGEIKKRVQEEREKGAQHFLLDVRKLRVVYGSGIGDLLGPFFAAGAERIALLWHRRKGARDRWVIFHATSGLENFMFEDEQEALRVLLSDESAIDRGRLRS